jgi:hypothetical protein
MKRVVWLNKVQNDVNQFDKTGVDNSARVQWLHHAKPKVKSKCLSARPIHCDRLYTVRGCSDKDKSRNGDDMNSTGTQGCLLQSPQPVGCLSH